jgi:hypothetical protein
MRTGPDEYGFTRRTLTYRISADRQAIFECLDSRWVDSVEIMDAGATETITHGYSGIKNPDFNRSD